MCDRIRELTQINGLVMELNNSVKSIIYSNSDKDVEDDFLFQFKEFQFQYGIVWDLFLDFFKVISIIQDLNSYHGSVSV